LQANHVFLKCDARSTARFVFTMSYFEASAR
jgi:hypothetical protein